MSTRTWKILIIFTIYAALHFVQSCCRAGTRHFDYHRLELLANTAYIDGNTVAGLTVRPDSIEIVASTYELTVTTAVYGTSCQPELIGDKHFIAAIEIRTEPAFNDTLTTDDDLHAFFEVNNGSQTRSLEPPPLVFQFGAEEGVYREMFLFTREKPQIPGQTFTVHVKITKTDGSVAEGTTDGVRFD